MGTTITRSGIIEDAYAGQRTFNGIPSNGTSCVQTITIGGTPTSGTFNVVLKSGVQSANVTWSATNATLLANLQTVLDTLFGATNTVATAGTLTAGIGTILVTYQNNLGSLTVPDLGTPVNNLAGSSPTVVNSTTTAGVTATHRGATSGSTCEDTTNGNLYINQGTQTNPEWNKVTTS